MTGMESDAFGRPEHLIQTNNECIQVFIAKT